MLTNKKKIQKKREELNIHMYIYVYVYEQIYVEYTISNEYGSLFANNNSGCFVSVPGSRNNAILPLPRFLPFRRRTVVPGQFESVESVDSLKHIFFVFFFYFLFFSTYVREYARARRISCHSSSTWFQLCAPFMYLRRRGHSIFNVIHQQHDSRTKTYDSYVLVCHAKLIHYTTLALRSAFGFGENIVYGYVSACA